MEKYNNFKKLPNVLVWLDIGQFCGQELEFSLYFLLRCLQNTTGRFSCTHSQNDLPIDFGVLEKYKFHSIENSILSSKPLKFLNYSNQNGGNCPMCEKAHSSAYGPIFTLIRLRVNIKYISRPVPVRELSRAKFCTGNNLENYEPCI